MVSAEFPLHPNERFQIGHVDSDLRPVVYVGKSRYPNTHTFIYADANRNIFEIEAIQDEDFSVVDNVVRFRASYGGVRGLYISYLHHAHNGYDKTLGILSLL